MWESSKKKGPEEEHLRNVTSVCSSCVETISRHNVGSSSNLYSGSSISPPGKHRAVFPTESIGRSSQQIEDTNSKTSMNDLKLSPEIRKQVETAEKDFKIYLDEKRRLGLTNLIKALSIGADSVCEEQRVELEREYTVKYLPALIQCYASIMLHSAESVFGKSCEYFDSAMPSIHVTAKNELERGILTFVETIKTKISSYLEQKQTNLTMCALDALSISVLDREEFWKDKTKRDVEKLHKLRLQEVYNDSVHSTPTRKGQMPSLDDREADISLGMWMDGIGSPVSGGAGASQRHRNILRHSPGSVKSRSAAASPMKPTAFSPSSGKDEYLRIRDINSSNILHDNTIDTAPVALGVGGRGQCHSSIPVNVTMAPSTHEAHEYFDQAHRIKERMMEKVDIMLHEAQKSLFVNPNGDEDMDGVRGTEWTAASSVSGRGNQQHRRNGEKVLVKKSDDLIDFIRGEFNDESGVSSHGNTGGKSPYKVHRRIRQEEQGGLSTPMVPREDAFQFIADLRVMNLQADLFLQRQKSMQQSLRVELAALEMNDTDSR